MADIMSNPSWCLRDSHVHALLQMVLDHWADWWGVERVDLPAPLKKRNPSAGTIFSRFKLLRKMHLEEGSLRFPVRPVNVNTDVNDLLWPERRMYAAVVRRALLDYARNCVSPYKFDQRLALNSYWWLMGYPLMIPVEVPAENLPVILNGEGTKYRLGLRDDPLEALGLRKEDLWVEHRDPVGYYPSTTEEDQEHLEVYESMSAVSCCGALGLDLVQLRRRAHLIPPDWGDTKSESSSFFEDRDAED